MGAVVERNVVSAGNLRGRGLSDPLGMICNAGIWTFHANGTVIQRNEVFGMRFNGCDGSGFDVDYDQDGTVVQFNYSHDNEGGFILLCTDAQPRTAQVRFNLSVDDRLVANQSPCSLQPGSNYSGLRFHNNTIVGRRLSWGVLGHATERAARPGRARAAQQRLLRHRPAGRPRSAAARPARNNLFFGLPATGAAAVSADPLFRDPARRGRGRIAVGRGFRLRAALPRPRRRRRRCRARRHATTSAGRFPHRPPSASHSGSAGRGRKMRALGANLAPTARVPGAERVRYLPARESGPDQGEQSVARAIKGRHPWRCLSRESVAGCVWNARAAGLTR